MPKRTLPPPNDHVTRIFATVERDEHVLTIAGPLDLFVQFAGALPLSRPSPPSLELIAKPSDVSLLPGGE